MSKESEKPEHPGTFIREHFIPKDMSVTEAAKKLGVGRPALSNLLNGNSSLSPTMALRLEKSFGFDRQKLIELQSEFDSHNRRGIEKTVAARAYVPSFLTITARQIHDWAEKHQKARQLLAVLLRKLVHSTGHELRHVDFPGYDNAERKGWDGLVEADAATPWVPEGKSCWEFSVEKNPRGKAERDYTDRLASTSQAERAECTFVFVTPRNWLGNTDWAKGKTATGDWKAVRAFDASDLEQWLEESIPAQMWLAEQIGLQVSGFETLDECRRRWEVASDPKMTPALFEPSIVAYRNTFKQWLEEPSKNPFVVTADSRDEALAFLSCLFQDGAIPSRSRDLAAVFKSADPLRTLAASSSPFIPIVYTQEAERELAAVYPRLRCIIVRPRNAVDRKPDIALDLLNHDAFRKALAEMGIEDDNVERLGRESGRSPTILRRRLSENDAISKPQWAGNVESARSLIPMALVGAWHARSNADREVVSTLADRPYQEIEQSITQLLLFDDSPVWSVGTHRGVASKIDALFAINKQVTEENLSEFFWLAEYALSESDPALDLPEDKRWVAGLYGKVRDHSTALRQGICETLVILSVHGNNLFRDRLGIDVEARVSSLIHGLLTPLSLDKLLSHDKDLPHYAEAAPEVFLRLLEDDLHQPQPVALGLLRPVESGPFSSPTRTGLLWALECLAWKHLGRVSLILAQMSRTVINDNWANKPSSSLGAIYRFWMPQTAASLEERVQALEMLTRRFPDIGWQLCVAQLNVGPRFGGYAYRPRWRNDASGAGQRIPPKERCQFRRTTLDLALAWPKHDPKTLGDLVERLPALPEKDQTRVWDLIDEWADSEVDERAKADFRERIRRFAFTRLGRTRALNDATKDRARAAYEKLQPHDPVVRHAWLFAQHWIEPSDGEIEEGNFDYAKHNKRIRKLRTAAMKEIWAQRGFEGMTSLLSLGNAPDAVGATLELSITSVNAQADWFRQCLSTTGELEKKVDGCIGGFLASVDEEARNEILSVVAKGMDNDSIVRLFRCAPFREETWRLLNQYDEEIRGRYWKEVVPQWNRSSESELIEIIDRLLEARRPLAAFHAVRLDLNQVETSRLKRLLSAVATENDEPASHYPLEAHRVSEALSSLEGRTGVNPDEMARLEFMFVEALDHSEHGIPNLERQIAQSPTFFVQLLAVVFKRKDDGQDPPEWRIEDYRRRAGLTSAAYHLLGRIGRIPGTGEGGEIDAKALLNWITEVRRLCVEHGRIEIGDEMIGQLLSKAPPDEDDTWPCHPVCQAMERTASQHISNGFNIGVCNGRGPELRDEGGGQERELAKKYRGWAKKRAFDYPYVSSVLESVAVDYERQAGWWDTQGRIEQRLRN